MVLLAGRPLLRLFETASTRHWVGSLFSFAIAYAARGSHDHATRTSSMICVSWSYTCSAVGMVLTIGMSDGCEVALGLARVSREIVGGRRYRRLAHGRDSRSA